MGIPEICKKCLHLMYEDDDKICGKLAYYLELKRERIKEIDACLLFTWVVPNTYEELVKEAK